MAVVNSTHRQLIQAGCVCRPSSSRHYNTTTRPPSRSYQGHHAPSPRSNANSVSSRYSRHRGDPEEADQQKPPIPRYLRREALSSAITPTSLPPSGTQSKRPTTDRTYAPRVASRDPATYRSRHYDPSNETQPKSEMRMLEPHVLSTRLRKLCDNGQLDAAVTMLKNAPLDAQNTPVWNTMIWESMKAKRFKLAYQLFVDMKRRGFSPTIRTFQTMFMGLSRIEHWPTHPRQVENARSIYEAYRRHVEAVKRDDPQSPELSINPLAAYIKILGDSGQYQEIFDVYYALDSEGPLSANQFIFTAMFQALSTNDGVSGSRNTSVNVKNAADSKLLWTQMLKASKKSPGFKVDSFIVSSAITALSRGRPSDQAVAFQIVREYFGLTAPGDPPVTGLLPLVPQSLAAVLALCNYSQNYPLSVHFIQQIRKRPEALGGVSIIDRAHMEEVLRARLSLTTPGSAHLSLETLEWMLRTEIVGRNGPKIRPSISTYNLVLMACWRAADWASAMRTFDLMTGYHSHDFMDGAVSKAPRLDKRAPGRNLVPTAETMSCLVRTALATQDRAKMRQCLRIVGYLGVDHLFAKKGPAGEESHKLAKNRAFYVSKLASAVVETTRYVLKGSSSGEEAETWHGLATQAQEAVRRAPASDFIPISEGDGPPTDAVGLTAYEQGLRR